jgi:nucleoside-diphosphate-sugar epimerase
MGYLGSERDFVHVSDVARAIIACLTEDTGSFEVFNVGSGVSRPIRDVVAAMQRLLGDERTVEEDPSRFRRFDRRTLHVDIEKLQAATSWRPRVSLEDGLADLLGQPGSVPDSPAGGPAHA